MSLVHAREGKGTLGTFAGVFTPSILTILGIILFLRLGFSVGQWGLSGALVILALASSISILTSLSIAAIATNLRVKRGGDYYLISRTLGYAYGGAIGLVMFFAQAVSIAFYCIGFGEVVAAVTSHALSGQAIAAIAVAVLFIFAWLGADWATRFQYVVMAVLALALLSFFIGGIMHWDWQRLAANWAPPQNPMSFWILFGLIFPAVTGFTQGVSMSGELRDPSRSLPLGTFLAVGISTLVYFGAVVVFAASVPREALRAGVGAMQHVALIDPLIVAGVLAATLSSAMASFLAAPRILQSLAADGIFPVLAPFALGTGASGNPRRGVLAASVLAFVTIALGSLNLVAAVVSMFFLISYGLINYATYLEARSRSPSFRPRFRWFDQRLSLLGALTCIGAMMAVNLEAGIAAVAVVFAVHEYLRRTAPEAVWADGRRSFSLHEVRTNLKKAAEGSDHPRDWRPVILAFSDDAPRRASLLRFANWIEGDSGFTTAVKVVIGDGPDALAARRLAEEKLKADLAAAEVDAYALAVAVPEFTEGMRALIQGFGIGPLRANLILLNWVEERAGDDRKAGELLLGHNLRAVFSLGCNFAILAAEDKDWKRFDDIPAEERRIDVWWRFDATSRLSLLLAYLMTRTESWRDATIRVLAVCEAGTEDEKKEELEKILSEVRIDAAAEMVPAARAADVAGHSADAALVFLPIRLLGDSLNNPFGGDIEALVEPLPICVLLLAAKDIELDSEPEAPPDPDATPEDDAGTEEKKDAD